MDLWAIWLILAGVLFIFEMFSLTFYMLWFGIGLESLQSTAAPGSHPH